MSSNEGLVDLSLFAYSPTDGRHFDVPDAANISTHHEIPGDIFTEPTDAEPEFYAPWNASEDRRDEYLSKPLPPLPPRTVCRTISIPRERESGPSCILNRMKRKRTNDSPSSNSNNLLRRRNVPPPPQLTLSVPQATSNDRPPPSEMLWMPEQQMWLIVEDTRQSRHTGRIENPTPPAYSPPKNYTRSEPSTREQSRWNITPPMSPVQWQLQSLMNPRDEERLSPLFQEAMNSVPMNDTFDEPPPPSYERTVGRTALHRASPPRNLRIQIPPPPPSLPLVQPVRASSTGNTYTTALSAYSETSSNLCHSQMDNSNRSRLKPATSKYGIWGPNFSSNSRAAAHGRSYTSDSPSSSALDLVQQELVASSRSWHGLARKLVGSRPRSAT
ncbi:MAG: hypothetical protein Q9164_005818 [Protoblastenia rupestris]